jgi:hypothetical protein
MGTMSFLWAGRPYFLENKALFSQPRIGSGGGVATQAALLLLCRRV